MPKPTPKPNTHTFLISSGYGANTRKPFVEITHDGKTLAQITPESARALAYNLITAAEAAEQDAFLFEFMTKTVQSNHQQAAAMLSEYRKWRNTNNTP